MRRRRRCSCRWPYGEFLRESIRALQQREYVRRLLKAGIAGYVLKKSAGSELAKCHTRVERLVGLGGAAGGGLPGVLHGGPRDLGVEHEAAAVHKEVADVLGISVKTAGTLADVSSTDSRRLGGIAAWFRARHSDPGQTLDGIAATFRLSGGEMQQRCGSSTVSDRIARTERRLHGHCEPSVVTSLDGMCIQKILRGVLRRCAC